MSSDSRPTGTPTDREQPPRSRSRTPPRNRESSSYVELLRNSQGQTANDVYFAQLTEYGRQRDSYIPTSTYSKDSKRAAQIRGKDWDGIRFETSVDVYDHDLELFKSNTATQGDVQEHLSYMLSDAKRKAEVSLKNLTTEERTLSDEAKKTRKSISGSPTPC